MRRIHKEDGFSAVEVIVMIIVILMAVFLIFRIITSAVIDPMTRQSMRNEDKNASESKPLPSDSGEVVDTSPKNHDKEKATTMYELHGTLIAFYGTYGQYPVATPEGWAKVATLNGEPVRDPYTDTAYVFTENNPEFGEIQYKKPASCDEARKEFVAPNMKDSFAFRLKFSDGIRCTHNL